MRWLLIICIVFGMVSCIGKTRPTPTITLVIPDGFSGIAILRWEQPDGIELPSGRSRYTLHLPDSGMLEIRGKNLMLHWYTLEARYASGQPLPVGNQYTKDEEGVYLWEMGVNADGSESWYVVGQAKDREGVLEKKTGVPQLKNPPGGDR